jgi:two-component sensor histidine kinase
MHKSKIFFIGVFLFLASYLFASPIDFRKNSDYILLNSKIYVDAESLKYEEIKNKALFSDCKVKHINLGFVRDTKVWIKLEFYNDSDKNVSKILQVRNPLLESVILYDDDKIYKSGMLYVKNPRHLNPTFELTLKPKQSKTYYMMVQNSTTSLRFELNLQDKITFLKDEYSKKTLIFVFFTVLVMLLLYNMTLIIYTKKRTYLYYCFYLLTLMAQQSTYLGLTQLYAPSWFIYYDNFAVVLKVNMMYISAAIFAKSFLNSKIYPKIDKIYNAFIILALIEIILFGTQYFYYPEIAVLTALTFIIFNLFAGYYIYNKGYKEARFFIIGWSFLVVGFVIMIFDGLGIITIMHKTSNIILFFTALEAIVLSLAFLDRYMMLKHEKEKADTMLMFTIEDKQKSIELEIAKKTKDLEKTLESKKTLLRELHHRTKNNLQLILSLIRMQSDGSNEKVKQKFKDLEGRISAIAKSHQLLYLKDDLQKINMDEYINELCNDLEGLSDKNLIIDIQVRQIYMPLREASYIGLIINELITNSIKYVNLSNIIISIDMLKNQNQYSLEIKDNGVGFDYEKIKTKGIGIKLVRTLVESQLDGKLDIDIKNGCRYMIEFRL